MSRSGSWTFKGQESVLVQVGWELLYRFCRPSLSLSIAWWEYANTLILDIGDNSNPLEYHIGLLRAIRNLQ